jgi:FKBP-type peptidyl-prolyl cis-trans isomerase
MNEYLGKSAEERNKLMEKQLFEAVKGQPGLGSIPSGVCYLVSREGKGLRPLLADSVSLNVKGYLPDGTVFEDSFARKAQLKATPGNLIPGLRDILQIMPEGSVWRIYIPSSQGYGDRGIQGIIPPWSALVFDVELVKVRQNK